MKPPAMEHGGGRTWTWGRLALVLAALPIALAGAYVGAFVRRRMIRGET